MTEEIEPMTVGTFLLGMMQAKHNREHPNNRCECKTIEEMARLHFEVHNRVSWKKKEIEK